MALASALACSDAQPAVDVAEVPEGWDEHRRRQNVTVRDANGGEYELSPEDVALQVGVQCGGQLASLVGCGLSAQDSGKLGSSPSPRRSASPPHAKRHSAFASRMS
ncbi:MAG: hypothetical protein R3B99_29715 [Polyangiales bacterium]